MVDRDNLSKSGPGYGRPRIRSEVKDRKTLGGGEGSAGGMVLTDLAGEGCGEMLGNLSLSRSDICTNNT